MAETTSGEHMAYCARTVSMRVVKGGVAHSPSVVREMMAEVAALSITPL